MRRLSKDRPINIAARCSPLRALSPNLTCLSESDSLACSFAFHLSWRKLMTSLPTNATVALDKHARTEKKKGKKQSRKSTNPAYTGTRGIRRV